MQVLFYYFFTRLLAKSSPTHSGNLGCILERGQEEWLSPCAKRLYKPPSSFTLALLPSSYFFFSLSPSPVTFPSLLLRLLVYRHQPQEFLSVK